MVGGLGVPNVAGVPGEMALFQGLDEGIAVDYRAARGIDQPGALPHAEEHVTIEEALGFVREGCFDDDMTSQLAVISSRRV